MKTLPYILLLTLFSHTLLWGQDDEFLKFHPLELVDTLHNLPPIDERNDFYEDDRLLVTNIEETEILSLFLKRNNYWENYDAWLYQELHSVIDTIFLSSNKQFLIIQHHYTYRMHDYTELIIIDLNQKAIIDIETQYRGSNEEYDSLGIQTQSIFEFNSKISFDGISLYISTDTYNIIEVYDFNGEQRIITRDTILGYNPCDGEYHYINGNFVKVKTYINQHTFTNTAYDLGEKTYLTPECAFYFECDCCSEHLLFTSDSTFVVVAPCTQDISVSQGKYEVIDNALHLHFSGIWQERYIVSDEPNKPTEYAYRTNTIPPHTAIFTPEMCKNTTLFTEQTKPQSQTLALTRNTRRTFGVFEKSGVN
jgi:hypothetical protein